LTKVKLEWYEILVAEFVAERKEEESRKRGHKNKHGCTMTPEESLQVGTQSVGAEMAVAKALDRYWVPGINTFKGPDVSHNIQVRYTKTGSLIVRPPDSSAEYYFMVTGNMPEYTVWGYIKGEEAKQEKYKRAPGGRPPAFFVPKRDLIPVDYYKEVAA
jgi:hypothetical protein